jgi:hypothetical protein
VWEGREFSPTGTLLFSTGLQTFAYAKLNYCFDLNLSKAKFATENMTKDVYVRTAHSTFAYADLSGLNNLNLNGTIFAAAGMTTNGDVETASQTFDYADLSGLNSLDLSETVFATINMTTIAEAFTGVSSFKNANFLSLNDLNLSGLKLGEENDGNNNIQDDMFASPSHDHWSTNHIHITDNPPYWRDEPQKTLALDY